MRHVDVPLFTLLHWRSPYAHIDASGSWSKKHCFKCWHKSYTRGQQTIQDVFSSHWLLMVLIGRGVWELYFSHTRPWVIPMIEESTTVTWPISVFSTKASLDLEWHKTLTSEVSLSSCTCKLTQQTCRYRSGTSRYWSGASGYRSGTGFLQHVYWDIYICIEKFVSHFTSIYCTFIHRTIS